MAPLPRPLLLLLLSLLATLTLGSPVVAPPSPPRARSSGGGTFDFLTINVAGLPAFLSDNGVPGDKDANARRIGASLTAQGYDIVHLQEDFNYHRYIYETDKHPHRTPTSGGVPFGSGLNTVANYPWGDSLQRKTWRRCHIVEADCLTPKGFSFMRINVDGAEVDLYNLHADAGDTSGDAKARSAGVDQVLKFVDANSKGRAIIIGGDTNDRWSSSDRSIHKYKDAGFEDVWVQLVKGGVYPEAGSKPNGCPNPAPNNKCELVDKVLYRSGSDVTLNATSLSYAPGVFRQPDGNIVTDHNPVHVEFSWST